MTKTYSAAAVTSSTTVNSYAHSTSGSDNDDLWRGNTCDDQWNGLSEKDQVKDGMDHDLKMAAEFQIELVGVTQLSLTDLVL